MPVRELSPDDFQTVSELCITAFEHSIAPTVLEQGAATFGSLAASSAFAERFSGDNKMFVLEEAGEVLGVIELKEGRHIAMLFVNPIAQGRGIGRQLVDTAIENARVNELTVSASLPSVPAYISYGFVLNGPVAESAGLVYQPMARSLS